MFFIYTEVNFCKKLNDEIKDLTIATPSWPAKVTTNPTCECTFESADKELYHLNGFTHCNVSNQHKVIPKQLIALVVYVLSTWSDGISIHTFAAFALLRSIVFTIPYIISLFSRPDGKCLANMLSAWGHWGNTLAYLFLSISVWCIVDGLFYFCLSVCA